MPRRTLTKSRGTSLWDKWLNGNQWTFDKGIDYYDWPTSLIKQLRYQAKKRGKIINLIDKTDDSFTIIARERN